MNTLKIFLRTDQIKKDGSHSVYIRLTINRRKKDLSLKIQMKAEDWDFNRKLVKKSDPKYMRKNKLITKLMNKAENIVDDYFLHDKQLSLTDFERLFRNKDYSDASFVEFVFDEIEKRDVAFETLRTYKSQITKLQQFKKNILFSEINLSFIKNYKSFMLNKLGNKPNTANKSLGMLKTFVNWGIEKRLIKENPFKQIRISKVQGERQYLSMSEVEKLEDLYYHGDLKYRQQNVLRYFLFVCYTGLRYSDIKNLKYKHIKKRLFKGNEVSFVEIQMHKTQLPVSIPLINKAKALMPKEYMKNYSVFKVLSNQKTNQYLKEIVKAVGIDKRITFHSARHTLATNGLEMGIPIEVVSKILGHTELKTTQIYAKVNDGLKYKEMMKLDGTGGK